MDKQKAAQPVTQKITRKLASESSDHKDVMNYYSTISRDETGAPVKWKMNSTHEEIVPGRGSPALAKIARSRSNSRDSSSERKKQDSENSQNKLSLSGKKVLAKQSQENVTTIEPEGSGKDSSVDDSDTSNKTIVSEIKQSENLDNSIELVKKVKKKGRPKSESFTHIKKHTNQTVKNVVINEEVDKAEVTVKTNKKKRGRPKSLDLMNSESMETVMNGEDDYFKSPHPLTPCNIHVKPKKGRPKETPPTLEPEPSISPNTQTIVEKASSDQPQSESQGHKRKAGPGRPAKKRKISGEISQLSDAGSEKLETEKDKKATKNKVPKNKTLVKTKIIGKRKLVIPLKAKNMSFKGKSNLSVKNSEKKQSAEIQIKRKGGRPPGSKNKPKPVEHLIKESKLRRNSKDSENSLDMKEEIEPSSNKTEFVNEEVVSDNTLTEKSDKPNSSVNTVSSVVDCINKVAKNQRILAKNVKSKDPLRKGLVSKGKVNPKSKALKAENSVPVVKRKKFLAFHAKKYTDSSIAILPSNDLRRKLYKKLQNKSSINEIGQKEDTEEQKVDDKEDDILLSELKKQNLQSAEAGSDEPNISDIQPLKSTFEVQNLSAMVESKRFAKTEKDLTAPVRKVGRPKKIISELGKVSDNESTCSEISSYSAVSYSVIRNEEMAESEMSKVKKKPGRKRKLTLSEGSLDLNSDLKAIGQEIVPKSDIIYDFAADEAANRNMKTAVEIIKRRKGRPKMLKPGNNNKSTIKKAFQSTMKQTIRTPMKKDVLKHLTKVKKAQSIKSKLLKPEFKRRKRENEFLTSANDSNKLLEEVKDEFNASGKCVGASSETGNPNGHSEVKLSMPKHSDKVVDEQVLDKDLLNVDYDKVDDTETRTKKDEKENLFNRMPRDIEMLSVQTNENKKSHQGASSDMDNKVDLSDNLENVLKYKAVETCLAINVEVNKGIQNPEVNEKDDLLGSSSSKNSQNSKETEESDTEKSSFQFDSKSIIDRAKAISFEVNEKKRLLKEKILKGREFSKSFMCKVVEANDKVDEGEAMLPDKEIDIEQCSTYSSKTEELSIGIDQEEKFLSDDGTDEMNFFEEENTDPAEEIVGEILITMIDQVCRQVTFNSTSDTLITDTLKDDSMRNNLSSSADERNIRSFLGNIPDSVQSMKTFNVGSDDSKNVTFKVKKHVSKVEPIKWRRKVRKREKKSTNETEAPVVRKIGLRQKISRSPLDNIALRQSIEENEYLREQMKKTKRGPKPKLKLSPTIEPETVSVTSKLLEQNNDLKQNDDTTKTFNDTINTEKDLGESNPVPAITINDLKKDCKPCSVILKDFLKELQMKSTMETLDESQESSQISEEDEVEENHQLTKEDKVKTLETEKSENCGIVESGKEADSDINEEEQRNDAEKNTDLVSENGEVITLSPDKNSLQKDELISLETKQQDIASDNVTHVTESTDDITHVTESKPVIESKSVSESKQKIERKVISESRPVTESMNKDVQKRRGRRTVKGIRNASGLNLPRRSLRPREASPKANIEANNDDATKDKAKKLINEISAQKQTYNVNSVETTEQTARKTVPPLKIKLQGGLTSKTKVYKVETAVNSSPSSVDSALDRKPKKKFKSKSKSDSESEKTEKRKSHHHAKKHTKSPEKSEESDFVKHIDKKKIDPQKTETLKAQDAYEANFLAFIQKQEKEDSVNMANWRNPVVSKTSHQLVGGKACKSGDDGSLIVSACALAETKTSSVGSDKLATLSKSSAVSTTENNVLSSPMEQSKKNVNHESINDKKSELEHFQQTEKVVNNLVSKIPSNRQYICNHCEFLCETQNEIMEHTKSLHKDQLLYSCTICHKVTFKTKPAIMAHFITHHQGMKDSYICLPDYFEKQIEPKPVKSPTDQSDNIFDRMSNLFDIQSSKGDSSKTVTNPHTENVVPSKTAAEADSTTKLDEGEDHLSNKPVSVIDDSSEEMTAAEKPDNEDVEDTPTSVKTSEETDKADTTEQPDIADTTEEPDIADTTEEPDKADTTEEPENEMNIKIVDVVSLKGQGDFNMETSVSEGVVPKPVDNVPFSIVSTVGTVNVSTMPTVKPSELKIPFYPVPQVQKVVTTVAAALAKAIHGRKQAGKTGTTYKCEACHVHAPVLAALVTHLKSSHTNIPKLFQCPYCRDMEGESEALIHKHIRQCHPTNNPNPPIALSEPAKRNLKTLNVELPEKADSATLERDIYMCLRCKKHFPSLEMTYNHLELEHRDVFVYVCPFCKVFKAKEEFIVNTHVLNIHHHNIDDINISLAIDGTQFVRVSSLIKEKAKTGPKTTPSPQAVRPQIEPRASPKQPVPNLTVPFNQNMAPLNQSSAQLINAYRQTTPQMPQNASPQTSAAVRPPAPLQGAKKRKATLSESIAQLTLQRQLQQAKEEAAKLQTTSVNQQGPRPPAQQPPPLLRGPPPLIRYDQLTKVPASLVAAQQYMQGGKPSGANANNQTVTSNILGQLTISAAERLQTLNNPRSQSTQIQSAPRPIQSALFDTSDPDSFNNVTRKQQGPVLNIPQISRTANRPPQQSDGPQPMQRNLITGSPLDLSNKSTPEPSPSADDKVDDTNPDAFKIFNIQPSAPMPQANMANIMPQYVRPNKTSTIAYRPTAPHIANVPISTVNMVPITIGNISLQQMQNLPQFVRMNFPPTLQQGVTSQPIQQIVLPQSMQQVLPTQSVQQVIIPQSLQQVLSPQALQQVIAQQSIQQVVTPSNVTKPVSTPQSAATPSSTPITTSPIISPGVVSEPDVQASTAEVPKTQEAPPLPMFKCPYCPQVVKLKLEEVKPHIEDNHPGSQVLLMPHMQ